MNAPTLRLACCTARTTTVFQKESWTVCGGLTLPSLLLSYAYEHIWKPILPTLHIREFVLDSGAFTAHASGKSIDVEKFKDAIYQYEQDGIHPAEIFSLDVIGNWQETSANTEYLWRHGIRAIPTFHYGQPEEVLLEYARTYPKIALGGAVGLPKKEKRRWVKQCFARVWPKPIHGFGFGLWAVEEFPFHTIDCSDWEGSAARFGKWQQYGGVSLGLGGQQLLAHLACEAQFWLEAEHRARQKWKHLLKDVDWPDDVGAPFERSRT